MSFLKTKGSTSATKDDFSQLTLSDIRQIPIKPININLQQPFIDKVDSILLLNKQIEKESGKFQSFIKRKFNLINLSENLQIWWVLSFNDFIKELAKKKIKLTLSQEAEWEEYFIQESKKAIELKSKIDQTDKEIDQMVYQLYELTDEEIAIVEGK